MKRQRRALQEASISFLDVISCGFGAIVLLLVIARVGDPAALEEAENKLRSGRLMGTHKLSLKKDGNYCSKRALLYLIYSVAANRYSSNSRLC